MKNIIHPDIFMALCSGYSWFIIFFSALLIFLVYSCMKWNPAKEDNCACYHKNAKCSICVMDNTYVGLIAIILALIILTFLKIDDRINKVAIECAKSDGQIWVEILKQDIEKREVQQKK